MTKLLPAADASASRWVLQADVCWWDLVRYGPPGFDVYLRIAFPQNDDDGSFDIVRAALAVLALQTCEPERGYAAVWEGWCGTLPPTEAPRVHIPTREMLLYTGPVDVLWDAPRSAWREAPGVDMPPHLAWPQDRAWYLACEVDEDIEFTVGCSEDASEALSRAFPNSVRRVRYGAEAPLYFDELE